MLRKAFATLVVVTGIVSISAGFRWYDRDAHSQYAATTKALVTGNGFGFAVFTPESTSLSKFYTHPYKFERPIHEDPYGDGVPTPSFIKNLSWADAPVSEKILEAEYLNQSQVISVQTKTSQQFYFMPFGLEQNVLILSNQRQDRSGTSVNLKIEWEHPVRSDQKIKLGKELFRLVSFKDFKESLLFVALKPGTWALVSVENPNSAELKKVIGQIKTWQNNLTTNELVQREVSEIEAWRATAKNIKFHSQIEQNLWRQSEVILRMGQSREPNRTGRLNHGLIIASLPLGEWSVAWVRDMAYATVALIRMGHQQEAKWALEAYFNARPIGRMRSSLKNFPYQIPVVRYFGDGSEETNFSGEHAPNIELDNWGLVLWVLSEYTEKFQDFSILNLPTYRGSIYQNARDYIVRPLIHNLDPFQGGLVVAQDTSIWEANAGEEQHFAFTTFAAINGLKRFTQLAVQQGDQKTLLEVKNKVLLLEKGYRASFVRDGFVHGTLEENYKNEIDSAVLEAINWGVENDPAVIRKTLDEMEFLRMPSGGYRRVRGETNYERQEFLYCNFNRARIDLRLGTPQQTESLIQNMVQSSSQNHNYIPEMMVSEINDEYPGNIGDPAGSSPMVGYGAGIFTIYLSER